MASFVITLAFGVDAAEACRLTQSLANDNPSREQKLFEQSLERELVDDAIH